MKIQKNVFVITCIFFVVFYFLVTGKEYHPCGKLTKYEEILLDHLMSSPMLSKSERATLELSDLAVVTSASLDHISEAIRSCDTFQQHPQLKNSSFLIYLADDIPTEVRSVYAQLCPVAKIINLNLKKYPEYVEDLSQYRFKAIYQALALQKYKVVLNIDASVRFLKDANFEDLIKNAISRNPTDVTLLSSTYHNVFASTHPMMFKCFPNIQPEKTIKLIEFQSGLILWINTKNGWKIMKKYIECALQKNCMSPLGAVKNCNYSDIYDYPTKFSGCHRFDQSAINLILFEAAGYQSSNFQWQYSGLYTERSAKF